MRKQVENKNDDPPQDSQLTKNRASPTMTSISGIGSSERSLLLPLNACSMLRKIRCIHLLILSSDCGFILVNERCLNKYVPNNAMIIANYKPFRKSHETQRVDSCLLHISETLPATLRQDTMLNTIQDVVWVGTEMGNESVPVGCAYCPPGSCQKDFLMMTKLMNIDFFLPGPKLIAGDFNAPGIFWSMLPVPNYLLPFHENINHGG